MCALVHISVKPELISHPFPPFNGSPTSHFCETYFKLWTGKVISKLKEGYTPTEMPSPMVPFDALLILHFTHLFS